MVTGAYLDDHPDTIFVYGDNLLHKGTGGAASLRYHPQTYGFVTKRKPSWSEDAFYRPEEYRPVFQEEMDKLRHEITSHPEKIYLISKLGSGLANRYHIYEEVISTELRQLSQRHPNVYLVY